MPRRVDTSRNGWGLRQTTGAGWPPLVGRRGAVFQLVGTRERGRGANHARPPLLGRFARLAAPDSLRRVLATQRADTARLRSLLHEVV